MEQGGATRTELLARRAQIALAEQGRDLLVGGKGKDDLGLNRDGFKDTLRGGANWDQAGWEEGLDLASGIERRLK